MQEIDDYLGNVRGKNQSTQRIPNLEPEEKFNQGNNAILNQAIAHNIVHFATHAAFVSGQPKDSFIVFGNGERVTLQDVDSKWFLSNVDLVVLSACQTGLGGFGNGEEILGFGYLMQKAGARAAVASLWSVDDGGTQALMNTFYKVLQNGKSTKSQALADAQIALISGNFNNLNNSETQGSQSAPESSDDFSHPYYWAAFILIGNGL